MALTCEKVTHTDLWNPKGSSNEINMWLRKKKPSLQLESSNYGLDFAAFRWLPTLDPDFKAVADSVPALSDNRSYLRGGPGGWPFLNNYDVN